MRSLVLSVVLWLAAVATLGAPPAADAHSWEVGFYAYPAWRGGSHALWRGGSHYFWGGGSHYLRGGVSPYYGGAADPYFYPGGYSAWEFGYGGYYPDYHGVLNYYHQPGISAYPYYDYSPPVVSYSTPPVYVAPTATPVLPPSRYDTTLPPDPPVQPVQADNKAHLQVHVPSADAQVFFGGNPTQQRGVDRLFASPALTPGQKYEYEIEARWTESGRAVDQTRTVTVSAGQTTVVDFTAAEELPALPKPAP